MTRDEIWTRLRMLWESTGRSAAAAVRMSAPAWTRLRSLWEARRGHQPVVIELSEAEEEPAVEETPAPTQRRSHGANERLDAVDQAIGEQDAAAAMQLLQPLLLDAHVGGAVLKRAARVMRLLDESNFAALFDAAAASPATGPAIDLASCFLELDDARMALAMARMALQRGGHDDPMVHALIAEAYARQGDHSGVIETLERFQGDWPEPTLLRRYALSTVLAGDAVRWGQVSQELVNDECASWILSAAERVDQFPLAGSEEEWYRWLLFAEYGALLIEPTPVQGLSLRPHVVAKVIYAVRDALVLLDAVPDRVAYVSKRGEVFARWLAQELDIMSIPLSARITGQSLLVVAADDADLEMVTSEPRYSEGPLVLFQVVKAPTYSGVPAPDIVGLLGTDVTLPIQPVVAKMAADRLPPRLMVPEIIRQAGPMLALEPEPDGALDAWIAERREALWLARPPSAVQRSPYVADMAQPPTFETVEEEAVEEAEADEASMEEGAPAPELMAEAEDSGDAAAEPMLSSAEAQPSVEFEPLPASVEPPPAS